MHTEGLERLRDLVKHFADRKARARGRLDEQFESWWCFGLLGFAMVPKEYRIDSVAVIRPVEEPPGEIELAAALRDKALMSSIGRYSHAIRYELAVNPEIGVEDHSVFTLAWWLLSALRVRTLAEILIPAAANCSWSVIAGMPDGSVAAQLIEDVPRARRLESPKIISVADLDWVSQNLTTFASLLEVPRFRLAVEALSTHHHEASLRMTVAALWSGIEAVFEVQAELRFRLATYAAALLEPRGTSRHALYRTLKARYDFRSKAVHGVALSENDLSAHITAVRAILSRLLCHLVELGHVPGTDEIDKRVFE